MAWALRRRADGGGAGAAAAFVALPAWGIAELLQTLGAQRGAAFGVASACGWCALLLINVVLLSCYTFGCHSFRHLIGGFSATGD